MVEDPDLRILFVGLKQRPEVIPHKLDFVLLSPQTGGHASILVCVHFVLHGDSLDGDSVGAVRVDEFKEVMSVAFEIRFPHCPPEHRAAGLHPAWRAPRRRKQKQLRVHSSCLTQDRKDVGTVMLDGKPLQLRVGVTIVEAVNLGGIVAGPDTGAAEIQP